MQQSYMSRTLSSPVCRLTGCLRPGAHHLPRSSSRCQTSQMASACVAGTSGMSSTGCWHIKVLMKFSGWNPEQMVDNITCMQGLVLTAPRLHEVRHAAAGCDAHFRCLLPAMLRFLSASMVMMLASAWLALTDQDWDGQPLRILSQAASDMCCIVNTIL